MTLAEVWKTYWQPDEANIYVRMERRRWPTRLASIQVGLLGTATLYGLTV